MVQDMDRFWVIRAERRMGPFSEAQVLRAFREGRLEATDRLWAEGLATPVGVTEALAHLPAEALREPPAELTLVSAEAEHDPVREAHVSAAQDTSPYRPPRAAVADRAQPRPAEERYAGFWVRFAAAALDAFILGIIGAVLGIGMALLRIHPGDSTIAGLIFNVGLTWLYFALGESSYACGSLGKRAFHLQVLSAEYLDRISFLRASGRFFGRYLSMAMLFIGYGIQPFTPRRRALHDFLAGTVVVVERQYSRVFVALMIAFGLLLPLGILAAVALPAYQQYLVHHPG
jgi:uncharacterized RDD family membrane protein YckC